MANNTISEKTNERVTDSWEELDEAQEVPVNISPRPRSRTETDLEYDPDHPEESEYESEETIERSSSSVRPQWVALKWSGKEVVDRRQLHYNSDKDRYEYVLETRFLRRGQYVTEEGAEYFKWNGEGRPTFVALKWSGEETIEKKAELTFNSVQGKYEYPYSVRILRAGHWVTYEDTDDGDYVKWGEDQSVDEEYPEMSSAKKDVSRTKMGKMDFGKNPVKYKMGSPSKDEDEEEEESEAGSINGRRTLAFERLSSREQKDDLSHTKLCNSLQTGVPCPHGDKCRFAHSQEQLRLTDCVFGEECRFVKCREGTDLYFNNKPRPGMAQKVCQHLHPGETRDGYMKRTGIDKIAPRVAACVPVTRSRVFAPQKKIEAPAAKMRQPSVMEIQNMQALRIAQLEAELEKKWDLQEKKDDTAKAQYENDAMLQEVMRAKLPEGPKPPGILLAPVQVTAPPPPPMAPPPMVETTSSAMSSAMSSAKELKPTVSAPAGESDTLVIRVPPGQYMMALEMAMKSGRGKVQVEIM